MFPFDNIIVWICYLLNLFWFYLPNISGMSLTNTPKLDSDYNYCEYDSTWEDDESKTVRKEKETSGKCGRNLYAAKDMQEFRHRCKEGFYERKKMNHDDADEPDKKNFHNLDFYNGDACSQPDGISIHQFHKEWRGEYERLEVVHSYIQWLFPIQEQGMNWQAHVLTKQEIKCFRESETAQQNLVKSYELMLDFYGIRLVNKETGDVERANNWKERFDNLNRYTHNNLRITRILKCLGTLGFEHYQEKLVKFFLHETLEKKTLPNVKKSVLDYFMFAVLDKKQRQDLVKYAFKHFRPQNEFVWGPKKILSAAVNEHEMTNETGILVDNKSEASEENISQEKESSGMQEGGMRPSPTRNTAEDRRGGIRQERVSNTKMMLDPAENESKASEENTTLVREPIRKREKGEILSSNTTECVRVVNEQKTQSSQSDLIGQQNDQDMIHVPTAMEDIQVKQSDVKDQMQGNQIPESDVEQTSIESDEISHDRKESSNSAQGEEKNGYVDHATENLGLMV